MEDRSLILKFPMPQASITLAVAFLVVGCANVTTKMVNKDGQERYCYLKHGGSWDRIPATEQYTKCLNEAGHDGYKEVK